MPSSDNAQKTPLAKSLTDFVSGLFADAMAQMPKAVPATVISVDLTNSIVTVNCEVQADPAWPQVTCPVLCPDYVRYPIQKGDRGYLIPSDYYLGGMSGLGGGTAQDEQQSNLSNVSWAPVGNSEFSNVDFPGALLLQGPDGVVLQDKNKVIQLILSPTDGLLVIWHGQTLMSVNNAGISMLFNGFGVVVNSEGTFIDGKQFLPHEHVGVQVGPDNTGGVS